MAIINVVGAGGIERVELKPVDVIIAVDQNGDGNFTRFSPAAVRNMEIENDGEVESITDMCGRTESDRRSDENWEVIIDGIVTSEGFTTEEQGGRFISNLTLQDLKNIKDAAAIRLESALHSGPMELSNVVISQSSSIVSIDVGAGEQTAFEFNLQLREPGPN